MKNVEVKFFLFEPLRLISEIKLQLCPFLTSVKAGGLPQTIGLIHKYHTTSLEMLKKFKTTYLWYSADSMIPPPQNRKNTEI